MPQVAHKKHPALLRRNTRLNNILALHPNHLTTSEESSFFPSEVSDYVHVSIAFLLYFTFRKILLYQLISLTIVKRILRNSPVVR